MTQSNKLVLVTGAGGGVGSELVDLMLTKKEYHVFCQYRNNADKLRQVYEKHNESFDENCFKADLTVQSEVCDLRSRVESKVLSSLWGIINLAGSSSNAMSWKMSPDDFVQTLNANLLTTFLTCREFIPQLRQQGCGRIINASSVVAFTGTIGASHYCAAKAGIVGLTKALALELANKKITANVLAMGYFDKGLIEHLTPELQSDVKMKTPLGRFGTASELDGLIRFLLSPEGSFTTGQVCHINGGYYL
jgi:3-oxoacyl-[acyl-carrier protein] reductase